MELQTPLLRMRMPLTMAQETADLSGSRLPVTRFARKALMVLYYFPPLGGGGTQRPLKFARYLPDYGWQPHVLTVRNSHYVVHDESLQEQVSPDLRITRTSAILPGRFFRKAVNHRLGDESDALITRNGFLGSAFQFAKKSFYTACFIPDEYIGWAPFAVAGGKRVIETAGIDLIFSSGPPNTTHLIARQLKQRTGLPWVADLRDLWDQYPDSYNPFRLQWRQKLDDYLESKTLRDADALVVVSEEMQRDLLAKFPQLSPERIFIVTNGYDTADFVNLRPPHEPEVFTVVHSGSLFPWRGLRPFLGALREFFDQCPGAKKRFRLKLLGIIPEQERAAIAAAGLLENVVCLDYLPYRQTLSHIVGAEIALLLLGENGHAPNVLTSKLFDYMGARRPILAIGPRGAAHQLIRQEKLGWAFRDDETASIAETLRRHFEAWRQGKIMVSNSRPRRFDRRLLTEKLSHAFNAVVG